MIRRFVKGLIGRSVGPLSRNAVGRYAFERIVDAARTRQGVVVYGSHRMVFSTPNALNQYRIETFATKEPDTLEWIDSLPADSVLWDIGANIGLYSIYAAKARKCRVYAFEPSVFNLELLAGNIFLNDLQERVTIVPLALTSSSGVDTFRMSNTQPGGALSTFGLDFDQTGEPFTAVLEYRMPGITARDAMIHFHIPPPDHLKIDVDGIEHLILRGCGDVLRGAQSVLIEISDAFRAQNEEASRILHGAGFVMTQKTFLGAAHQFNQLWERSSTRGLDS